MKRPRILPAPAPQRTALRGLSGLAVCLFLTISPQFGCSRSPSTQVIRSADGNTSLYVEDGVYTFRRNNWSFYAWVHSGAMGGDHPRVLIHLDSHSDMHPAPVCEDPDALLAGDLDVAEAYTRRLSISSFMFPVQHYGLIDEVYWVQPPISPYQGPVETVSYSLEESDGWIRPKPDEEALPLNAGRWSVRSFRGQEVPRSLDVAVGAGYAASDWAPGPSTLHCLSLDQMIERIAAGDLEGKDVLVDLDVDYFGTTGPIRGYGYLTVSESSQVALGVLGRTFPLFYATRESQEREIRRVAEMIRGLSPKVVTVSESPDHAHREGLPFLVDRILEQLLGRRQKTPAIQSVQLRIDSEPSPVSRRETRLSPECPSYVDLAGADTVTFVVKAEDSATAPMEASLFYNPLGSDDRLIYRTSLRGAESDLTLAMPSDTLRHSWLGPGWELEIRSVPDGQLLWTAAFCLDDDLSRLKSTLEDLAGKGLPVSRDPLSYASKAPSEIITEGRSLGLQREYIHRILLAHPRIFEHQCRNLQGFRRRGGTVELATSTAP